MPTTIQTSFETAEQAQTDLQPLDITSPQRYYTAQEAWLQSLRTLSVAGALVEASEDPFSIGSSFGKTPRTTKELIAASFSISSPQHRLIHSSRRRINIGFAIANTLWALSGSNSLEVISFYNPRGNIFSDDGKTLFAASGKRIFDSVEGDQFDQVTRRLRRDPQSRRAVMQIFLPKDLFTDTRDCSCTLSLQFLIRNNQLHCITFMRSQSALMVFPYDVFLFTMIHEAVAASVGVGLGSYSFVCSSLHYYDDEAPLVQLVLEENKRDSIKMPAMNDFSDTLRSRLTEAESCIRYKLSSDISADIDVQTYGFDEYWTDLLQAMVFGAKVTHGFMPSISQLAKINPIYQQYFL